MLELERPERMGHELFPAEEDDPKGLENASKITKIYVQRQEPDGLMVYAPAPFAVEELPDIQALHARFGGGSYTLTGRGAHGQLLRKHQWTLAGPRLPLVPPPPAPSVPMSAPAAPAEGDTVLKVVMALMANMMDSNTKMMVAMLDGGRNRNDSAEALTELIRVQSQTNNELLRAHLAPKTEPDRSVWKEAFEMGRAVAQGAIAPVPEDSTAEKLLNGLAKVAEHVAPMVVQLASPAPAPASAPAPSAPLPVAPPVVEG